MKKTQLNMNLYRGRRGGRRPGAGRKKKLSPGVRHRVREKVTKHTPVHVNFKVVKNLPNLRNKIILKCLKRAVMKARLKGLQVIYFSLQSNHVHLIIEASSNTLLSKGMMALSVSFAKSLNGVLKRAGIVQKERYHLQVLKALREVRNAVQYVLHQKHIPSAIEDIFTGFLDLPSTWLLQKAVPL